MVTSLKYTESNYSENTDDSDTRLGIGEANSKRFELS